MKSHEPLGFEPFDRPQLRVKLEEGLFRIGFRLVLPNREQRFIAEYKAEISPLGEGEGFILQLAQDWNQEWSAATLYSLASMKELEEFDFNRQQRFDHSCFDVWIEDIIRAVRTHSSHE